MKTKQDKAERLETSAPIIAIVQGDGHIEVWDEDGELHYGNLPKGADGKAADILYQGWKAGFEAGQDYGKALVQGQIRAALGL